MASLVQLKRKIRTASNVSKATKAMQMISASKLRRAQQAALASRPYSDKLIALLNEIVPKLESGLKHPYMQHNESKNKLFIVISPDKGLAGGMIANLTREIMKQTKDQDVAFINIGRKIERPLARTKKQILASFPFGNAVPSFAMIAPVINIVDDEYLKGNVGSVFLTYTKFASAFTQIPTTTQLLPFNLEIIEQEKKSQQLELVEPSIEEIIPSLLNHYMEMVLYQGLLESFASEHAARMAAMQSATDNANQMVADYTLSYNKIRQEKITGEILDISGGAVAAAQA